MFTRLYRQVQRADVLIKKSLDLFVWIGNMSETSGLNPDECKARADHLKRMKKNTPQVLNFVKQRELRQKDVERKNREETATIRREFEARRALKAAKIEQEKERIKQLAAEHGREVRGVISLEFLSFPLPAVRLASSRTHAHGTSTHKMIASHSPHVL